MEQAWEQDNTTLRVYPVACGVVWAWVWVQHVF
jgi:hypothetical protein